MKKLLPHLLLSAAVIAAPLAAQPRSPEVHPDGRVTFRLHAPDARAVAVTGEPVDGEAAMARGDDGVWSFTSAPLEPDIYVYNLVVDGVRITDPANPLLKYNLLNRESQVHVPGPDRLPWELNDVPRGRLHRHFFRSTVAGDERDFIVYTPPGYGEDASRRYPVLYLLHGYSDDATAWTAAGYAHVILDNLIARDEAAPMIVVMPLGYGTMDVIRQGWAGLRRPDGSRSDAWVRNVRDFRPLLLKEIMPRVEEAYRVQADAGHRAIAGLSMGGTESLYVGLNERERFGYVGAFSSGGLDEDFASAYPGLDAAANRQLKLLWIACGVDDGLIGVNRELHRWLEGRGVRHEFVETPGGHSFRVWRRNLAAFAPRLFR